MSAAALDHALALARAGFYILPLNPNSKVSAITKWPEKATRDPGTIRNWFADPHADRNIGVYTGRFGDDGESLLVVDVDVADGKPGEKSWKAAKEPHDKLPRTCWTLTPSGGQHVYFKVPGAEAVKSGAGVLGEAVDVRGAGGYVAAVGSTIEIDGEPVPYEWGLEAEPAPAPQWLIERCGAARPAKAKRAREKAADVDPAKAEKRAREYLATLESVTEGARNDTAFRVAAHLKDIGCDRDATFALMSADWKCEPMLEPDELRTAIGSAYSNGQNPQGSASPEAYFEPVESEGGKAHPLEELNREYAVVIAGADGVVFHERPDLNTGQRVFNRMKLQTFKLALAHRKFVSGNRTIPLADAWLESPRRRFYPGGVEFAPGAKVPPDTLNLWGGFAVAPKAGDWSLMRAHIRDVVCGGDEASYDYVLGWLANMVQRPNLPGQVALVLKGGRGTGKSTFGELIGRMFGRHFIHLNDPNQLTGRFSAHLACKVFVLCDEAVFVGDKASEPRLKALITERSVPLEAKGVDIIQVRNTAHLLLCSNDSWVVRAGNRERRYAVFEVSDSAQQDTAYFGALRAQMENGGTEAMLHDLQHADLSGFDIFKTPQTDAAIEQRTNSLPPAERWLYDSLNAGRCGIQEWTEAALATETIEMYRDYLTRKPAREFELANNAFSRAVQKVFADGKTTLARKQINRKWHLILPPLSEARRAFDTWLGSPVPWDPVVPQDETSDGHSAADMFK